VEDFDDSTVYTFPETRKVCIGSMMITFTSHVRDVSRSMCPKLSTYVKFINENRHSPGESKISYFFNTSKCISITGISQNSNNFLCKVNFNCYNKLTTKTSPHFITE
jgi:hypothetical protein